MENNNNENHPDVKYLAEVLQEVLKQGSKEGKYIDIGRIPFICQDIKTIHERIEKIDDNIAWIVKLVIGAVVLGFIAMIFK